jgi:glycosyltransferase involved in cell wall biosynthesis
VSTLVSIVTPFRNAERFLADAAESVRAQTHQDWELLLVNDGSSDGSVELARRLAAGDQKRMRLLDGDPARRGVAAARNRGIAAARGQYVSFLDADDVYLSDKLAADVAAFASDESVACVYGATRWWFDGVPGRDWTERLGVASDKTYAPPYLFVHVLMEDRGDIPCTCGVTVRRSAVEAVGGFEERFALYEDQALWAKLFLAYPVRVASGCRARYRQHAASTSARAIASGDYDHFQPHRARIAFLEWIREYAQTHGQSQAVTSSIDRALGEARSAERFPLRRRLRRLGRYLPRG